jgi:hypothetical protein
VGFDSGDSQVPRSAEVAQFAATLATRFPVWILDPTAALKTLVNFRVDLNRVRSHVWQQSCLLINFEPYYA